LKGVKNARQKRTPKCCFLLQDKTRQFKERLAQGETLDALLPEAFAAVSEAASRVLG
ncbi:MAG TPA: hypothetical protein H9951_11555, partial [Candidatus Bacteroides intestinigallinarum]|nr:hypothetical protein [Candidatus Bacteroides intestinigallinarum]